MEKQGMNFKVLSEEQFNELMSRLESIESKLENVSFETSDEMDEFLTRDEVCKILKVSKQTLFNWQNNGVLVGERIGTRIRYRKSAILKLR